MKVYYYITIFVGIIILLNLGGYATPSGGFVGKITSNTTALNSTSVSAGAYVNSTNTEGIQNSVDSTLFDAFQIVLALGVGAAIVAGLLGRSPDVNILISSFIIILIAGLFVDIIWIYSKLLSFNIGWIKGVSALMFTILVGGFLVSIAEWWKGTD